MADPYMAPCPFCGTENVTMKARWGAVFVQCGDCGAQGPSVGGDRLLALRQRECIERWSQVKR